MLAIIEREFSAVGLAPDFDQTPEVSGLWRLLVEQYYAPLDWDRWADVMKFTAVYENVLLALENAASDGVIGLKPNSVRYVNSLSVTD